MLMQAVANEIGSLKVIALSGVEIHKEGPEMAVAMLRKVFDTARENAPSVVFVDEIDTLVPSREGASEIGVRITGELLQELDGIRNKYSIVFVAATNRPEALDPAILRSGRIDKIIFVAPPGAEARATIFKRNLEKAPLDSNIDFGKLGELAQGYTGADIANICRQIKIMALEREVKESKGGPSSYIITMDDISSKIKTTKPSAPNAIIGKYLMFLSKYGQK
jgi:transitional endoplasmic reticulum ATPase